MHTAIYVGRGPDEKHYVIENAGGDEKKEGAWLKLNGTVVVILYEVHRPSTHTYNHVVHTVTVL